MKSNSATAYRRSFQLVIFGAAALLFAVQPIISKHVLPWYGGSSAVWTTSLLFFQSLLFAGYALAHLVSRLGRYGQWVVLAGLTGLAAASLPIVPGVEWRPGPAANPLTHLVSLLLANVGWPYLLLAAASPLIQTWAGQQGTGRAAYRLYAWSNAGSLVGLLSYPLVVEPFFSTAVQAWLWSGLFGVTVLGLVWLVVRLARIGSGADRKRSVAEAAVTEANVSGATDHEAGHTGPGGNLRWRWLALPLTATWLLVSLTNYLSQDIAAVPFLWILPLALYLFTFIVAFSGEAAYDRRMFAWPFLFMGLLAAVLAASERVAPLFVTVVGPLFILALYCFVLHGELYRLRPGVRRLTEFYLWLAAGGALGGLLAAVIAPMLLPLPHEFHLAIALTNVLVLTIWWRHGQWQPSQRWPRAGRWAAVVMVAVVVGYLGIDIGRDLAEPKRMVRNFYGSLQVVATPDRVTLKHGKILHGWQMTAAPCEPTSYYGWSSGLGRAVRLLSEDRPIRLGMVGLGAGVAASLADEVVFYEINPQVVELANTEFSFLRECGADSQVVLGDARLSLADQPPQNFDLLALDAFSGDSIPIHLLTREAFVEYSRHLAAGGVIAVHISNQYLDLAPVLHGAAQEFGWTAAVIDDAGNQDETTTTVWVLLFTEPTRLQSAKDRGLVLPKDLEIEKTIHWTDRYSSLLPILRF